jgi:hypothetical protein
MVSVCFVMKWSSPMHDISMLLCLGIDNFMTKHTDNMSGLHHFMTKHTDNMSGIDHFMTVFCHEMVNPHAWYLCVLSWNGQAPWMVSDCFVMKWSSTMHGISLFYHEMVNPHAWYQCVWLWNGQAPCMVSVCFVITISWQNTLIPCMGLYHFMTKQTDTMSGDWQFLDKTHWYYFWGCHEMVNPRHIIGVFCHEMVKPRHIISVLCHEIVNPQT